MLEVWDTPYHFFVSNWWYGLVFHLACHWPMWLTKAGRWSSLWDGKP